MDVLADSMALADVFFFGGISVWTRTQFVYLHPKPQSVLECDGTQTYLPNTLSLKMSTKPGKLSLLLEDLEHSRVAGTNSSRS